MEALHLIGGGDSGGARTHVLSLLSQLNRDGEALLLALGDGPLARDAEARRIPCRVLRGDFGETLRQTESACRELSPGVLHCHGSRANLIGALLRGRLSCPVITTVHSDPRLDYAGRPLAAAVYGTLNAWALRRMDALVCVSRAMTETMGARGFGELYTVYNGIDPARPPVRTERAAWRAEQGIPPDAVLAGTAARMDAVKDLPTLLRGFARAAEGEPRLYLALAGTGREERKLRALAEALGLGERVRFPGWVEDMESFLDALDIFTLSSVSETFPFVLLAAGRAGLPAAASRAGGVPELIENEKTGLLFPPGDSAALGQALTELARDEERRRSLGAALRERTRAFTPEKMAVDMRIIYQKVQLRYKETEK